MEPSPATANAPSAGNDAALVRQVAAARSPEALAALYDRYAPTLLALIHRVLGDRAEAEEVLQEVFVHLWNRGDRYDPARSSVSTWLVLVARSRAIDRLRSRRVAERTVEAAALEDPAPAHRSPDGVDNVFMHERRERVRRELAKLPPEQRQVLDLAFYGGLTQSEIASTTGIPLGTVKTRTLLAMKKLRQALRSEIRELL